MKRKYISIALILLIFTQTIYFTSVFAQKLKRIDKQMLKYEYAESTKLLEKIILEKGRHTQEAMEKLALCYRLMNEPEQAAKWYAETLKMEGTNSENHYYYAEMLRTLGRYKEAQQQFLKYASLVPEDDKGATLLSKYCEDIIPYLKEPANYTMTNASMLNTEYSEFSPAIYKSAIVFTSDRPRKDKHSKTYSWTGNSFLNLYASEINYTQKNQEFTVANPAQFSKDLSQTYHDGTAVFSKDWKTVYFTRTTNERVKKGDNPIATIMLKMYSSHNIDGHWTEPEPFYLNSNDYSVGHPALSVDGKKLYFASDMPNGFGETDIYECTLENDTWTNVQNLGDKINTSRKEMFPYISDDGSLYFSSTGHLGYGGFDIYSSKPDGENWKPPENMGMPLNSSYDDFGVCILDEGKGFISSNRPDGLGNDDLYTFEPIKPYLLTGRVVSDSGTVLRNATVFLLNKNTNKVLVLKTDYLGKYSTEVTPGTPYILLSKKDGYFDDCISIQIKDDTENQYDLILAQIPKKEIIKLENIYYDLDKWSIRPDAIPNLTLVVKALNQNPINIELSSFTDSRASNEYNIELSKKRTESVMNYIISQGIDMNRILANSYGESRLINECPDNAYCTEEQHQMNRRTEFNIIEFEKQETNIIDELGKYQARNIYNKNEFKEGYFYSCKKN